MNKATRRNFSDLLENLFNLKILFSVAVTKFIRIGIADKNDNPPYFDKGLYEAEVDENEDIQHTVLTVTAKDHDECKFRKVFLIFFPFFDMKNFIYSMFSHFFTILIK